MQEMHVIFPSFVNKALHLVSDWETMWILEPLKISIVSDVMNSKFKGGGMFVKYREQRICMVKCIENNVCCAFADLCLKLLLNTTRYK